jgi:hypothetical protein
MCRETPPIYIDILFLYGLTLEKNGKKMSLNVVAGGVGFLWVGLCFVVGKHRRCAPVLFGLGAEKGLCFPPTFHPLSRLVAVSQDFSRHHVFTS